MAGEVTGSVVPKGQLLERDFSWTVLLTSMATHLWDAWGWFSYRCLMRESHFWLGMESHTNWYVFSVVLNFNNHCYYMFILQIKAIESSRLILWSAQQRSLIQFMVYNLWLLNERGEILLDSAELKVIPWVTWKRIFLPFSEQDFWYEL